MIRVCRIIRDGNQLYKRSGVIVGQLAVVGPVVVDIAVGRFTARRLVIRLQSDVFGGIGHSKLAGHSGDCAGALPVVALGIPEVVHVDILVAALLVLRQHPEIAQNNNLALILSDSDVLLTAQRIVRMIIERFSAVLFRALVQRVEIRAGFPGPGRFGHIPVGVLLGHILIGISLRLAIRAGEPEIRLLCDIKGTVELIRVVPSAHRGNGAVPLVVVVPFVVLQVVFVDVPVTQGTRREHIGKGHGGGAGRRNRRLNLAGVAARQLEHLGHVVRGRNCVFALWEDDAAVARPRLEGHGPFERLVAVCLLNLKGIGPAAVCIVLRLADGQLAVAHHSDLSGLSRLGGAEGVAGNLHGKTVRLVQVHLLHQEITARIQTLYSAGFARGQGQRLSSSVFLLPELIGVGDLVRAGLAGIDRRRGNLHPAPFVYGVRVIDVGKFRCVDAFFFSGVLRPLDLKSCRCRHIGGILNIMYAEPQHSLIRCKLPC